MRKITSILMLLLFVFSSGVSAQGIKVSTDAKTHWFVIKNFRSGKFAAYGGEGNAQNTKKDICQLTLDNLTDACYWYAVADGEGYKLYNAAATGKVVNGHAWSETGSTMYVKPSSLLSGYYTISTETDPTQTDNAGSRGCWDDQKDQDGSAGIGFWKHVDNDYLGTSWLIVEVDNPATLISKDKVALAVRVAELSRLSYADVLGHCPQSAIDAANNVLRTGTTSDEYTQALTTLNNSQKLPDASKYYVITSTYGKYEKLKGVTKSIYATESDLKWKTTDLTDNTMYWCISKNTDGNWTFQNYGNNKYIASCAGQSQVYKMGITPAAASFVWHLNDFNILIAGGELHTAGHDGGNGEEGNIVYWNGSTGSASAWTLREVEDPEAEIAKATAKANLQATITKANFLVGVNPGQYPSTDEYSSALTAAQEILNSTTATKDDYDSKLTALENALGQAQTQTKNDLKVGCYYRIQNTVHKTYTGVALYDAKYKTDSRMYNYALNSNDPCQIWKLEKTGDKYFLVNVGTGLYPQYIKGGSPAPNSDAGAKNDNYDFTWEVATGASSTSMPVFNIKIGGRQVNIEPDGKVDYWYQANAYHYLWKVEKTDAEILALVKDWVRAQGMTTNYDAQKLQVIENVTKVISPNEFAEPNVVNAAIDAVKAYAGTTVPTLKQAQAVCNNYAIVNNYVNNAKANGGILDVKYELKGQYGTIILPVNYASPQNVKFYTCEAAEANGVLTLVETTTGYKKNQPYIVEYTGTDMPTVDNPKRYQIIGYKDGAEKTNQKVGLLTGVLQEGTVYVPSGSYILSKYNGRFAFYKVAGDNVKVAQQYRCYLTYSGPTAVSAFYLNGEGETTGINTLLNGNNGETEIYDLSGKRLNHLQKGINIVNGQKVLVK